MASVIKNINICNFQGSFEPIFLRLVFHSLLDTIVCGNPCYYLLLTIISIQVNPRSYKVEVITYCLYRKNSSWDEKDQGDYTPMVTISKTARWDVNDDESYEWSFFNIKTGKIMSNYDYSSVSDFWNGLACVYQRGEYSNRLKVINEKGVELVDIYCDDTVMERTLWNRYGIPETAMYSNGVILQNSAYYFYDFSNVTSDDIGSQESIETCYDNDSNIRAEKVETPDEKFRFSGLDCDFTLPEEIPIIGGGQVKIDFSKLPVSIERSGNVIRIGFGILQTENDESQNLFDSKTWDKLKTSAEKMQSNATNGIDAFNDAKDFGCVSMPMSKKVKTNVTGYVEGTLKNGKFTDNVTGRFVFQISASVKKTMANSHCVGSGCIFGEWRSKRNGKFCSGA